MSRAVTLSVIAFLFSFSPVLALSPSPEVVECFNVPAEQRTAQCQELVAGFGRAWERWNKNNPSKSNPPTSATNFFTNKEFLYSIIFLVAVGISIIIYRKQKAQRNNI